MAIGVRRKETLREKIVSEDFQTCVSELMKFGHIEDFRRDL